MPRLDQQRQADLEPKRMDYAMQQIEAKGYIVTIESDKHISFVFGGNKVVLWPYSGWHSGKGIKPGRGIKHLLKQI
jgi:hypothetical protein